MTWTFWRLSVSPEVATAVQGTRGRGRWNTVATHPVYAASSVALAALERLLYAQFDTRRGAFETHHLFRITIPEDTVIDRVSVDELPAGWVEMVSPVDPASVPTRLQTIGDAWVRRGASVALVVPSAHAWEDTNALLNPAHPDFPRIAVTYVRPYRFDHRFAGRP